jgi:hypothetical protein
MSHGRGRELLGRYAQETSEHQIHEHGLGQDVELGLERELRAQNNERAYATGPVGKIVSFI